MSKRKYKCVMLYAHRKVQFLFLVKVEDRNSQSVIAKSTCPQAQASPQGLEHSEEQQGGVDPHKKCPTLRYQSSPSPKKHVLVSG